jgi:uncharacterized phage protein (TIGR01671 family)
MYKRKMKLINKTMRKIKFRAWDKEKGMLHYDGIFNSPNFFDNSNLMQFTGLKDKNEKEIYEGDVVKDVGIIGEIIYVECSFRINPEGNKKIEFTESLLNYDNLEVIGNIHENPELLTNK